jgi:FG-GAP-like repeat
MKFNQTDILYFLLCPFLFLKCSPVVSDKNAVITDIANVFTDEAITCNPSPTFGTAKIFKKDSAGLWFVETNFSDTVLRNSPMNLDIQKSPAAVAITVYNSGKDTLAIADLCSYNFTAQALIKKYTASKGTIQISHSRPDTIGNFISCTIDFTLKDISLQGPPGNSFSISNLQFSNVSIKWLKPDSTRIKQGWPIIPSTSSNKGWYCSPNFCDINNDGYDEILATDYDGYLSVWNHDGTPVPGWPYKTNSYLDCTPAVGDVDGDGNMEIGVISNDGNIYVLSKNGALLSGWPVLVERPNMIGPGGSYLYHDVVITDIDGDGRAEIIYASSKGNTVYVFKGDGTTAPGWPKSFSPSNHIINTPCVADLKGDGTKEIACVISGDSCNGKCFSGFVYLWHNDGSLVSGWPRRLDDSLGSMKSKIITVPIAGQSTKALFVSTDWQIYAYNYDGSYLPGWPMKSYNEGANDLIACDLDNDGQMEIVATSAITYVFNINGTQRTSFYRIIANLGVGSFSGLAAYDIDNDGKQELICSSMADSCIWIYRNDGTLYPNGRIHTSDCIYGSPIVGDFDRDGITDVAIGSSGKSASFTVWSLNLLSGPNKNTWQRQYCTIGNTGQFPF